MVGISDCPCKLLDFLNQFVRREYIMTIMCVGSRSSVVDIDTELVGSETFRTGRTSEHCSAPDQLTKRRAGSPIVNLVICLTSDVEISFFLFSHS